MTSSPDPTPEPIPASAPEASTPPPPPRQSETPTEPRRLTRSHSDRMVAGVAGGIAEYFDLDASLVRIAIVVLAIFSGGTAIILYLGAWLVLPESDARLARSTADGTADGRPQHWRGRRSGTPALIWGVLLILAGALLLARQADLRLPPPEGILAGGLILVGLLLLLESRRGLNSGLLVLAVLLSLALATVARADVRYDGAFSERTVVVERIEDLEGSYGHAFGQLHLDLRGVQFPEGTTEITVASAFGSAEVRVPRDVPVRIEGTTLFGSSKVRGQEVGGFGVDTSRSDAGYANASRRLLIRVTTLFGSTEVQ